MFVSVKEEQKEGHEVEMHSEDHLREQNVSRGIYRSLPVNVFDGRGLWYVYVCVCANAQMMGIEIRVRKWFDCCKMKTTSLAFGASAVGIHMEIENVFKIK